MMKLCTPFEIQRPHFCFSKTVFRDYETAKRIYERLRDTPRRLRHYLNNFEHCILKIIKLLRKALPTYQSINTQEII